MDASKDFYTAVGDIPGIVRGTREAFLTGRTKPLEYRKDQLRKLFYGVSDHSDDIIKALNEDMHKPKLESKLTEIFVSLGEILYQIEHMDEFAKDEKLPLSGITLASLSSKIVKEPLGNVLIISPWNYPVLLTIGPAVAAIAAGNTFVLKLSESAPSTAKIITKIFNEYLDKDAFRIVNGEADVSSTLLQEKFDKILYTGGSAVGSIVYKSAAKHLTPVVLELGGKSPVLVTENVGNIHSAAKRILWGKIANSGQTCVAPDYLLVDRKIKDEFIRQLVIVYNEFFPNGVGPNNPDTSHIVNDRQFNRIKGILDSTKGKILIGGISDDASDFIPPTVVENITLSDSLMKEELFGPLLPIIFVDSIDESIKLINKDHPQPLALYIFSNSKKEQDHIIANVPSGGVVVNDTLYGAGTPGVPFGGIGQSGMGSYHGKDSFDIFTHRKPIMYQASWADLILGTRYPPFSSTSIKMADTFAKPKPWFPRTGPVRRSIVDKVLYSVPIWLTVALGGVAYKLGYISSLRDQLAQFQ